MMLAENPLFEIVTRCLEAAMDFPSRSAFRQGWIRPDPLQVEAVGAWGADLFLSACGISSARCALPFRFCGWIGTMNLGVAASWSRRGGTGDRSGERRRCRDAATRHGSWGGLGPRSVGRRIQRRGNDREPALAAPSPPGRGRGEGELVAQQNQVPKADLRSEAGRERFEPLGPRKNNFTFSGWSFWPPASLLAPYRPTTGVCASLAPRRRPKLLRAIKGEVFFALSLCDPYGRFCL
jgi:hypothetical protein